MYLKLTASTEKFNGVPGYTGWIDQMPGVVVHAESREKVREELLLSLKVKLAFDYNIPMVEIKDGDISLEERENVLSLI